MNLLKQTTLGALASLLIAASSGQARAQSASDKAAAEAAFDDGKRLMSQGDYVHACPKFVESQKLDAGVGTLLYLGDCYERLERTASAWATFREAAAAAKAAGQADREQIARKRAAALEPRLSKLVIVVHGQTSGLEVKRDAEVVGPGLWGTPIPVDPGGHAISASAPGKKSWTQSIDIAKGAAVVTANVPELADAPAPEPTPVAASASLAPTPAPAPVAPQPVAADSDSDSSGRGQRTAALVMGGAGALGVVVGTIFGLQAKSKHDDAVSHCKSSDVCTQDGLDLNDDAKHAATVSTIGFVAGGALLAGGLVMYVTAPKHSTATALHVAPALGPGVAGIAAGAAW